MKKSDLITIRPFDQTDEAFIISTWIQGYQGGQKWFKLTPRRIFWDHYYPIVKHLIQWREIKIACLKKEPDVIIGYSVFKDGRVDWIYVKQNWRKIGVAKDLLPSDFNSVSHLTNLAYEILKKRPEIIFNPFL